jgi:hypothetical protein
MKEAVKNSGEVGSVIHSVVIEEEQNSEVAPLTSNSATTFLSSNDPQKHKF